MKNASQCLTWGIALLCLTIIGTGQKAIATPKINPTRTQLLLSQNLPDQTILQAKQYIRQGNQQLQAGQAEVALESWEKAESLYRQAGDTYGVLGSQMNQSQALQALGFFRSASVILSQIHTSLDTQPNDALKVQTLANLGTALQVTGDLNQAKEILLQSLALAQTIASPPSLISIHKSLGQNYQALGQSAEAFQHYNLALSLNPTQYEALEIQLDQLELHRQINQFDHVDFIANQIQASLSQLPPSRRSVFLQVNWAQQVLKRFDAAESWLSVTQQDVAKILSQAILTAQTLQDQRAESFATGQLAAMYEQTQQWSEALSLNKKAIASAQDSESLDLLYQWQWQAGRIYRQQAQSPQIVASLSLDHTIQPQRLAVQSYSDAVQTLNTIRISLLSSNQNTQLSYQESVEPVYRELADLLLHPQSSQTELEQARDVIENLQLAELENFFRSACIDSEPSRIDAVDSEAAVLYPIILGDRLEVVTSLPNQGLSHHSIAISQVQLEKTLTRYLSSLNPRFPDSIRLGFAAEIYDWMITPIQTQLEQQDIQTLVFVMDGMFRNIPMASLHTGEKYLIEDYAVAIAPGLQQVKGRFLEKVRRDILVAGLTESRQGFSALPAVKQEIAEIEAQASTQLILDQKFTAENLQKTFVQSNSPILHLATHGQFSSKPEETFLLSWNKKIDLQDFQNILSQARITGTLIELLVLSACQTASGDRHAALGLAGLAIRSGALSTVGTLWSVQDESTSKFMTSFYQRLSQNSDINKADLLRKTQQEFIHSESYQHPYYWAPFILVGNWQ